MASNGSKRARVLPASLLPPPLPPPSQIAPPLQPPGPAAVVAPAPPPQAPPPVPQQQQQHRRDYDYDEDADLELALALSLSAAQAAPPPRAPPRSSTGGCACCDSAAAAAAATTTSSAVGAHSPGLGCEDGNANREEDEEDEDDDDVVVVVVGHKRPHSPTVSHKSAWGSASKGTAASDSSAVFTTSSTMTNVTKTETPTTKATHPETTNDKATENATSKIKNTITNANTHTKANASGILPMSSTQNHHTCTCYENITSNADSDIYYLNYLPGFSESAICNRRTLSINDIVKKDARICLLTTYELDLGWLFKRLPWLPGIPTTIVHGNVQLAKENLRLPPLINPLISTRESCSLCTMTDCDFENTLVDYVKRLSVNPDPLFGFDFSTASAILIPCVPGIHTGDSIHRYGHMKIRKILASTAIPERFASSPVLCQFSSLGSLNQKWVTEFHTSFSSGLFAPPRKPSVSSGPLGNRVRLIWPTVEFVRNSIDGYDSGGSLCLANKNIKEFFITNEMLYKYEPPQGLGREAVPPHIKTYTRVHVEDGSAAWVVVTSANMSSAAWGCLQKNGTQLLIRHYELGVLCLPQSPHKFFRITTPTNINTNASTSTTTSPTTPTTATTTTTNDPPSIPLPYGIPLGKYTHKDHPWVWDIPHTQPDIRGLTWPPKF
ncbi:tyrosyl-DNA phosphodiesterase 1 [Pelomyxa schiedti]|nr:tyrosyl-DNA phosphodiesterase 1 [Pelomyxa schiedti]